MIAGMCRKRRPKNEDRRPKTLWSKTKTHWSKTKTHWSKTKTYWSKSKTHWSKTKTHWSKTKTHWSKTFFSSAERLSQIVKHTIRMSSEPATNFTLTLSQSIQRVTNCVTQFDFHNMEIYVSVKIFVNVVVANILFFMLCVTIYLSSS